ncbi:MAG: phenylalanyl-tRNA synthetase alpha chain [Epulopiscium sp.]|jgi:phenylalanyl-tRNA synthetase alpha chain|uniref:Phenylalanine--tRNA ligase alpha subunit n=1 Tax=Defluviitalea raffinosedens TaxID=1450156 RepID=A0A7C8LGA8_9FIRM|nr:phenylalanine--tRNA ligase subunit alpha [Defluviitalea raffinosedens]MBZ4667747.1 pheS [Defluviitaleaceae bacterium]MDK2787251.1 phenylalanyl-tRNA synthetase alpha chain [Candidatus Epulonipiscium sp.]KAE9636275.1 phenylalanine--tRNA ligase subunit alpha [Defluviitalea raffinosedens]MBM7685425.1 phenylalanyl-tRNA synthetase alpha chain [Defluviitalea raffinosedens]HHW66255.1 phenylalanine--tRNA ligase subunit alpha [Candidatus Epulonipiscium sp.]
MKEKLQSIKQQAMERLKDVKELKALDEIRVEFLGKKGELTQVLRGMKDLSAEERPIIGQMANEVREAIEGKIEEAKNILAVKAQEMKLKSEVIDVTMPGRKRNLGHRHPMNLVVDEIKEIFLGMGYKIAEGPEIETEYYNFEALNIPAEHPARDEQDTFYINKNFMLRTATSPIQVRVMENEKPPIRIICPGKVYRSDEVDATHSPVFHQLEGLVVDKNITFADLKGALEVFAKELFGDKIKVRFRPHFFPFTEPSAEMDVACVACGGEGCRVCKGSGWIEILGCGMVHPKVLKMAGIDPDVYTGFAFGMGLERLAMSKYGIKDLRLFVENDVRFLDQF